MWRRYEERRLAPLRVELPGDVVTVPTTQEGLPAPPLRLNGRATADQEPPRTGRITRATRLNQKWLW